MASSRRKPQRKGSGRKRASRGSKGGSTWLWGAALIVLVGGIAAYDNSSEVRRFADRLMADESPVRTASRKTEQQKPAAPVPPREVSARAADAKRGGAPQRQDALKTAAIRPPAPIGKPEGLRPTPAAVKPDRPMAADGRHQTKFYLCGTAKQDDCVVTPDTFMLKGQKIRIAGIEVPSIKKPRCEAERIKASDAKLRVRAFLDAGPFDVVAANAGDEDSRGQKIRAVTRNGVSLSDILVREGLARRPGAPGGWC